MMREPVKALPRRPWPIIAAAMIMDVMCIVVAVVDAGYDSGDNGSFCSRWHSFIRGGK